MSSVRALCLFLLPLLAAACGQLDAFSTIGPDHWRSPKPEPAGRTEPAPDAPRLIRNNLKHVFMENAQPQNIRLSRPRREPTGTGWNVCVKADVTTVGQTTLARTYVVPIERGEIGIRRLADPSDGCEREDYTRL